MPLYDPAHAFVPYPDVPVPHASTGPLSGLYFGVKDLFDVAGYPTGGGNPLLLALSGIKSTTAPTVQKLLNAGAALAGKTVTDELAFSMNGNNAHFGAPLNGAAPERISGGSSSGSASAVSNQLCDFALGTDTGGSVRAPASHCGLYGIRPTHGRVSLESALALCHSLDTCGWFARDACTFARVADVLLAPDTAPLPARPAWDGALQQVARSFGAGTETRVVLESMDAMYWAFRYIQGREAWMTDGAFIERYAPVLGPGVKERFAWSKSVTDAQFSPATQFRARYRQHLADLLGQDGVLLMPTMPDIAPLRSTSEAELETYRNSAVQMLCIAGLSGFPQISLPLAGREGAPLGISLLGPAGSDRSLIAMAEQLARAAQ